MPVQVLLVDDSAVIRGLMSKALSVDPQIHIAATASDGLMAIGLAKEHQPDIIILDIEMPVMDGLAALPELLKISPRSKVIMASTLTLRNASVSMQALQLGAVDYLAKPSAKFGHEIEAFYRELIAKVKGLAPAASRSPSLVAPVVSSPPPILAASHTPHLPGVKALAIATSTGGPQALLSLFGQLKGQLMDMPIFITQHMPATFTTILAEHISKSGERSCIEVKGGEVVKAGMAYLAPGNFHLAPEKNSAGEIVTRINQEPPENFCRPAADPMFRALSHIYGSHLVAVVLTGMGQDGMLGAKEIVAHGGSIIAQNEASCVVYGMPKAVVDQRLCRAVLPLNEIANYLVQQIEGR